MGRGRPGKGLGHVDGLEGLEASKERLKRILETVSGERTVKEAARAVGLSESRFAVLREQVLQAGLDALAPGTPGRPPTAPQEKSEVERLREQLRQAQFDLHVAQTRTELALTMPHVLKDRPEPEREKGGSTPRTHRKKRWF